MWLLHLHSSIHSQFSLDFLAFTGVNILDVLGALRLGRNGKISSLYLEQYDET